MANCSGRWYATAMAMLVLLAVPSVASAGDPWEVRADAAGRAERLLRLLEAAPDSEEGLTALVAAAGARAVGLCEARAARQHTWQSSFIAGRLWLVPTAERGGPARTSPARVDHAEVRFQQALQLGSEQAAPKLLGWIGEELVRAGQPRRAEQLLRRWEARRRDDADALALLARLALERRDSKTALRAQRRTAELRPHSLPVRLVLARLLHSTGEIDDAVREYETAVKLAVEARDSANECQTLIELGELLELLERFDDAVAHYRRGLKLAARGSWAHNELQRRILQSYERRADHEALQKEAKKMLAEDSKNLLALKVLATEATRGGKLSDAVGYYKRYLDGAPGDGRARSQLMFLLVRSGRHAEAAQQAGELHKRHPKVLRYAVEYAHLLHAAGQTARAQRALREAIPRLGEGEDLSLLVTAFEQLGDAEGMRLAWKAALQRPDPDGESHRAYGAHLWKQGRRTEAFQAWSFLPGSPPTRFGYERWSEVLVTEGAASTSLESAVLKSVRDDIRRGLKRFPGHGGLTLLAKKLGVTTSR